MAPVWAGQQSAAGAVADMGRQAVSQQAPVKRFSTWLLKHVSAAMGTGSRPRVRMTRHANRRIGMAFEADPTLTDVAAGTLPTHVAKMADDYLGQEERRGHGVG